MSKSSNAGFTLIELMITVAIVGILASIAYPAYTSSILKGKRAEGRAAVTELMQQQERYMTQRNTYLAYQRLRCHNTLKRPVQDVFWQHPSKFSLFSVFRLVPGWHRYTRDLGMCSGDRHSGSLGSHRRKSAIDQYRNARLLG